MYIGREAGVGRDPKIQGGSPDPQYWNRAE